MNKKWSIKETRPTDCLDRNLHLHDQEPLFSGLSTAAGKYSLGFTVQQVTSKLLLFPFKTLGVGQILPPA